MGTLASKVLWGLRLYGPIANADLARRVGLDRLVTFSALTRLRNKGLAATGRGGYEITESGRAELGWTGEPPVESQMELFGGAVDEP